MLAEGVTIADDEEAPWAFLGGMMRMMRKKYNRGGMRDTTLGTACGDGEMVRRKVSSYQEGKALLKDGMLIIVKWHWSSCGKKGFEKETLASESFIPFASTNQYTSIPNPSSPCLLFLPPTIAGWTRAHLNPAGHQQSFSFYLHLLPLLILVGQNSDDARGRPLSSAKRHTFSRLL